MLRTLAAFVCLSCPAAALEGSCVAPEGDHILGGDLARALPEFSAVPREAVLGTAPIAGARRVFRAEEISALAARYSIKMQSPKEVCFEWPMEQLDRAGALEAMRNSLALPDARVEIAEAILDRVPRGRIEFPRESLSKPAMVDQDIPVLWRGSITYGGAQHFAIWARVRIKVQVNVFTATEMLKVAQPIRAEQIRLDQKERFPDLQNAPLSLQQVIGMLPLRSVTSGGEVRPDNLTRPNDVSRGDLVVIEVRSGNTRLTFSGRAESAGRTGDMIAVRNPESNKIFRARICAKDKAIVEPELIKEN